METDVGWRPSDWLVCGLLIALTGACAWLRLPEGPCGGFHDDGLYTATAKSLAENGAYRLINLPGAPAQTKYPPAYPWMLAAVWLVFPDFPANYTALLMVGVACCAASSGVAYWWLVQAGYFSRGVVAAGLALTATNPEWTYYAAFTLSEMPFTLASLLALAALDRRLAQEHQPSVFWDVALGVGLATPFLFRTVGVLMPLTALILLFSTRQRWWAVSAGAMCVGLAWLAWGLVAKAGATDGVADYYTGYASWWLVGYASAGKVALTNLVFALTVTAMSGCRVALQTLLPTNVLILSLMVAGCVAWVAVGLQWNRRRSAACFLLVNLALLIVFPWPPIRLLMPSLPILTVCFCWAWSAGLERLAPQYPLARRCALSAALVAALAGNLWFMSIHWRLTQETGFAYGSAWRQTVSWSDYEQIFAWVRENTEPGDLIASNLDPAIYLYCDRTGFRPYVPNPRPMFYDKNCGLAVTGTAEDLHHILTARRARYLVLLAAPGPEERPFLDQVSQWREAYPDAGVLVDTPVKDPRFAIYRLKPNPAVSVLRTRTAR